MLLENLEPIKVQAQWAAQEVQEADSAYDTAYKRILELLIEQFQ